MPRALRPYILPFVLIVASVAYRLPMVLSAAGATNSDSAVVGLQAMHFLSGAEHLGLFLWGSHYQTSADSLLAAASFAVFGASPRVLMSTSLAGHVALTLFVYFALVRSVGRPRAFALASLLILSGAPVHGYALFPPRQVALTLTFAAFFLLDAALPPTTTAKRTQILLFFGALTGTLAVGADPYTLIFVPSLALVAAAVLFARAHDVAAPKSTFGQKIGGLPAIAALVTGAALGIVPFLVITTRANAAHGTMRFATERLLPNAKLLAWPCLPWALGGADFAPVHFLAWDLWPVPLPVRLLSALGALLLVLLLFASAARLVHVLRDRDQRRDLLSFAPCAPLALAAWLGILLTLLAFLVSVMVMDLFSTRYLVSAVLLVPFALAPLAARMTPRRLASWLLLPLLANVLSGVAAYGPFVQAIDNGAAEAALQATLESKGIRHAYADYWVSYRLSFVTRGHLTVAPIHAAEDRYPPYRQLAAESGRVVYIFDPLRSREPRGELAASLERAGIPYELVQIAGYDVVISDYRAGPLIK